MKYTFPNITHVDQVRKAIAGCEEMRLVEKDDYIVVNYFMVGKDTFPLVTDENSAIRRECRGIIFSQATGRVLARRYHKFFNLGERGNETMPNMIDFTKNHVILEKLDGSMITPFMSNGRLRFGTKMGYTDVAAPVEDWVFNPDRQHYINWIEKIMLSGATPIFEWCSRSQRIVIDYPVDRLVLTAIRNNVTGEYTPYESMRASAEMNDIDVVKAIPGSVTDVDAFVQMTKGLKDEEGYIIRFDDGHMLKVKADEYLKFHGTLSQMNFEKDIIRLILKNEIDDCKPYMHDLDRSAVDRFQADLVSKLEKVAEDLKWKVIAAKENMNESKKRFALEVVAKEPKVVQGLMYQIWDGKDPLQVVVDYVANATSSQTKVDSVRGVHGLKWWDYRKEKEIDS